MGDNKTTFFQRMCLMGLGYGQALKTDALMEEAWNTGKTHIPSMPHVINVAAAAVIRQNIRPCPPPPVQQHSQ